MIDLLATFIFFFAVIDPIGTVTVFVAMTKQHGVKTRRRIALLASLASASILMFFVIAGEYILAAMKIPLPAFQIAGGIVLFLFALSMIFGESKPEQEVKLAASGNEKAIFPLAVPSIAGPGAMLVAVLHTENSRYNLWEQAQTAMMMLLVIFVVYLLMLSATWVHKFLGNSGASVISRVMGLILASIATSNVLTGITDYFML